MPGTPPKRYCTGSAQVNRTACECVTMRKLYFSKAKNNVWTQAEADQKTWSRENMNYPVKLLCTSLHVLYYCRNTSYEGGTAGIVIGHGLVWFPVLARGFSLLQTVQTGYGSHTASYSVGTGCFFLHLPVEPPLRMSEAIPLLWHMCSWHARGLLQLSVRIVMDRWNTNMAILEPVIS
jgi:hypothetical protein